MSKTLDNWTKAKKKPVWDNPEYAEELEEPLKAEEGAYYSQLAEEADDEEFEDEKVERKSSWELLKEEIIGQIKVVMRKNEKMTYIEVRATDLGPKQTVESKGFAQFFTILKDDEVDGPGQALEYFQGLVAWFKGGRQGRILPFDYADGS